MKKLITRCLLTTVIIYTVVYFIKSFICWNLANPFQWLIDMPTYKEDQRVAILFGFIMYWLFNVGVNYQFIDDENQKSPD